MECVILIKEPASFFYLLESISNWDIHTRENTREYLEGRFKFNNKDRVLISRYVKIRKKYPWKQLDTDFIPSQDFKEVKRKLKRRLNEKEFVVMEEIIDNFSGRFCLVFNELRPFLIKRKEKIESLFKEYILEEISRKIGLFYGVKNFPKKIYISLLANPCERGGGGANVLPAENIEIEPRNLKKDSSSEAKHDLAVIIHELIHLIEKRIDQKKWRDFEKRTKEQGLNFTILREAIASTLAPEGYITKKFGIKKKSVLIYKKILLINPFTKRERLNYLLKKLSARIYPLTKRQFEKNKNIFEGDYLENCFKRYKKLQNKVNF